MAIYQMSDPEFFDKLGSDGMEWTRNYFRDVNVESAAIALRDDPNDETAPAAVIARLSPGHIVVRHAHDSHRVEVLLVGSMTTSGGQTLTPGDVQVSRPGEMYGPNVVGPDGAVLVEFIGRIDAIPPSMPVDGTDEEIEFMKSMHAGLARHKAAERARVAGTT